MSCHRPRADAGARRCQPPALVGVDRGAIGAAYVLSVIVTTRPLGVALMVASVVVGQSVAALLIDHYGWFGVDTHRLSPMRVIGVVLLFAGVLLIRSR